MKLQVKTTKKKMKIMRIYQLKTEKNSDLKMGLFTKDSGREQ